MELVKYVHNGKDVAHDVHFWQSRIVARYGSDDEPKKSFISAWRDLQEYASGLAGITVAIKKIQWNRKENSETTLKIECQAAAQNGDYMKVHLPGIGYRKTLEEQGDGMFKKLVEAIKPCGIDRDFMQAILRLEKELGEYVRSGSSQLEFSFAQEDEKQLREAVQ